MSEDIERAVMYIAACQYVVENDTCATPQWCVACHRNLLDVESAALAYDLAVAFAIHGRGAPTATRLAAHDLAIREGIAWS